MPEPAPPAGARDLATYRARLGRRLRSARIELGLSLSDVQRLSAGAVSAPALSSYERADRAISAARLALLAQVYDVPIATLLPPPRERVFAEQGIRAEFDLDALRAREQSDPAGPAGAVVRFLTHIARLRSSAAARISVRHSDLIALAALCRLSLDELLLDYAEQPIIPEPSTPEPSTQEPSTQDAMRPLPGD
jgi:transcriptional regulator with XRE-family HTH domain